MVGALQIALSPATLVRSAKLGTGGRARPRGTGRAPQTGPASIIRNGMAVCLQKHEIQKGPLTHPTNPEVAACRAPVFGLRFLLSVSTVFRANLARGPIIFPPVISSSSALGRIIRARAFLVSLDFQEGRLHVTHKFKGLQRESAHASGTIRKPWTRTTR